MSLLECNLSISEDESTIIYSAPYKKMEFGLDKKGGFIIETRFYSDPENRFLDNNRLFFFDIDEKEIIIDWLKHIK